MDASPPSFSPTSSTVPPPLYSPSMSINDGGLRAAKGGSVVGLGSVEREGPAGGRCPRVYDQLPDG